MALVLPKSALPLSKACQETVSLVTARCANGDEVNIFLIVYTCSLTKRRGCAILYSKMYGSLRGIILLTKLISQRNATVGNVRFNSPT